MRCKAYNCKENDNGYCSCDSYVTIDEEGCCEEYLPITNMGNELKEIVLKIVNETKG